MVGLLRWAGRRLCEAGWWLLWAAQDLENQQVPVGVDTAE